MKTYDTNNAYQSDLNFIVIPCRAIKQGTVLG